MDEQWNIVRLLETVSAEQNLNIFVFTFKICVDVWVSAQNQKTRGFKGDADFDLLGESVTIHSTVTSAANQY